MVAVFCVRKKLVTMPFDPRNGAFKSGFDALNWIKLCDNGGLVWSDPDVGYFFCIICFGYYRIQSMLFIHCGLFGNRLIIDFIKNDT